VIFANPGKQQSDHKCTEFLLKHDPLVHAEKTKL